MSFAVLNEIQEAQDSAYCVLGIFIQQRCSLSLTHVLPHPESRIMAAQPRTTLPTSPYIWVGSGHWLLPMELHTFSVQVARKQVCLLAHFFPILQMTLKS